MSARHDVDHLNEEQLLWAMVESDELPEGLRNHLTECQVCRAAVEGLETDLAGMGKMAGRFAASPRKRIVIPLEEERSSGKWLREWRWAFTAGISAAVVLIIVLGSIAAGVRQERRVAKLYREMVEDERLMLEVGELEDNALPPFYSDISEGTDQDMGDGSIHSGIRLPDRHVVSLRFRTKEKPC